MRPGWRWWWSRRWRRCRRAELCDLDLSPHLRQTSRLLAQRVPSAEIHSDLLEWALE